MLTLGDVLAATLIVLGCASATLAALVLVRLLFPRRVEAAAEQIENRPWATAWVGLFVTAPSLLLTGAFASAPSLAARLFAVVAAVAWLAVAMLGAGGIGWLTARRVREANDRLSPLTALTIGSGLLVVTGMIPLVGWFVVLPLTLLASVGAGVQAIWIRPSLAAKAVTEPP